MFGLVMQQSFTSVYLEMMYVICNWSSVTIFASPQVFVATPDDLECLMT